MSARADEVELTVERVGARGDGIAQHAGAPVYLPFTAPGDRVRARLGARRDRGRAGQVLALPSPGARETPACRHFGTCGGCALQHLAPEAYRAMKEEQVRAALRHRGLDEGAVAPLQALPAGIRRRARLALERTRDGESRLGFRERASHRVVDMQECPMLDPRLTRLLPALRALLPVLLRAGERGEATMTAAENGVDLLLQLPQPPDYPLLQQLGELAAREDVARLCWRPDEYAAPIPIAVRRAPRVLFAGAAVEIPAEGFLQASEPADRLLASLVLQGLGSAERVADLYCGVGTFALAVASGGARVRGFDASAAAVAALRRAAVQSGLSDRLAAEVRDLARQPLMPEQLAAFDAVVFDPPRAGAEAQARGLAASAVPVLVAVSCNPASFARDARILVDGGYRLARVVPVDQFIWSPHVELVAEFRREPG